jgi:hypothetical protein
MPGKFIVNRSRTRQDNPAFPVDPFVSVVRVAYELAGREFSEPITSMDNEHFSSCILIPLLMEWKDVIESVLNNGTKIDVRFLGDLKEHSYNPDVVFFSATKDIGDDFPEMIRKAASSLRVKGGGKMVLVNLANVREVSINVGRDVPASFSKELERTLDTINVLNAWAEANEAIAVEEI